jgi:hypothetical protein
MIHVLIDGDNIQYETFINNVKDTLESSFGTDYKPIIFCQTNVLIKYKTQKSVDLQICCSKTTNKNASDARIILEVGKLLQGTSDKIVVVSNDKIFEEITDNIRVFNIGYQNDKKKVKLKKNIVISAMKDLISSREKESDDVYLCDLYDYMQCTSVSTLKEYIQRFVPELYLANNDAMFFIE